jgi:MSHA biogenesis protein MshQ
VDSDGVLMNAYNLDTDAAVAGNDHRAVGGFSARYGRIKVSYAYGAELYPLTIPVAAQYWNNNVYVNSIEDALTTFTAANVVFSNYQKNLNAGETSVVKLSFPLNGVQGSFQLSAPGGGNNGSVNLNLNAPTYLPSTTSRATFGLYKGNQDFIYLREVY